MSDGVALDLREVGSRPAGALRENHPLVRAAVEALRSVGETRPHLESGSTDANLPLSLGYPSVCIGLTRGGEAHTLNEYIDLEPLQRGYQALLALIRNAFRIA
jgi:acetylornithine deacetylase/succinyl-diaminopimelate desuccinylase-like protein